jgi:hypothetical protein
MTAMCLALVPLIMSLSAVDHTDKKVRRKTLRNIRYTVSAFCLVILVGFQSFTFAVITSDFCDEAEHETGGGAGFSPAAVLCFFFSGLVFLVMGDLPEIEDAEADAASGKDAYEEASLADTEELTVEHVEDDQSTEYGVNEQVLNDVFFDPQEIEVLPDPFVGSTGAML